jgi:hypothetical protein
MLMNIINDFFLFYQADIAYINGNSVFHHYEPKIYGISHNPHTKNYIMVFPDGYHCNKCCEEFIDNKYYKWCKPCQINDLKKNFTNWTSGNEKIDKLIQEKQLRINHCNDIIVEWIPHDQFNNIEKDNFTGIYSAIWKDGPLYYDSSKYNYSRKQNKQVNLKYLQNSQNFNGEFLNEV